MSKPNLPAMVEMQHWTTTPPNDTGLYWFRAEGVAPTIARLFFQNAVSAVKGRDAHNTSGHSELVARLAQVDLQGRAIAEVTEEVAILTQRPNASWGNARLMPPETVA